MCLARYSFGFRLEMLLSMNALVWAVIAAFMLILRPGLFPVFSLLFWGAGVVLYGGYPWIPGSSGWLKGLGLSLLIIMGTGAGTVVLGNGNWHDHWGWMLATLAVCFWLGFDLRGIVEGSASEATGFLEKIGIHSIGKLYASRSEKGGVILHDMDLCTGCLTCLGVCPKGVFDFDKDGKTVSMARAGDCFACGACVCQCPERALKLS
jgi:NAD-dependent dihydropyrimidine dehydrogenase PreA subunit